MSDPSGAVTAHQWLERQLEQLGGLFNAGVRSPVFREWRQATLTCIQRIWPGEVSRSERFRRIPFSPPMGRPEERDIREYFERGCGEAGSLLKEYVAEIEAVGVQNPGAAAFASPGPADEDAFPTVDLPGRSDPSGISLGFPPAGRASAPSDQSAKKIAKPRLKDLLGFSEDPAASAAPVLPPTAGPAAPVAPAAPPAPETPRAPVISELEGNWLFVPTGPAAPEAATPGRALPSLSLAPKPDVAPKGETAAGPPMLPRAPGWIPGAPVRNAQPQALGSGVGAAPREIRSPVALAILTIASEVEALDLPEGHRARARAALLDLSRRLDAPDLPWGTLRDAIVFLMEYPTLGRRVVPMLLPFFDRAA